MSGHAVAGPRLTRAFGAAVPLVLALVCAPLAAQAPPDRPEAPIIPDDEFDASIPPIDADPAAPLGTLEEWQREQARRAAEPPPEAPAEDPALREPLTPLGSFDVGTFDESRYTESDEGEPPAIRYRYRIDGLDTVKDEGAVSPIDAGGIRAAFRALSALEDGKGKAANGAMVNARMEEDAKLLTDILSGQGYFDARVNGALELPAAGSSDPVTVILAATPGPRYRLGAIRFDAPPAVPADLIAGAFAPSTGEPIVAERMLAAEANIAVVLPEQGYPFVQIGQRDILLDEAAGTGDYTLPVTPGPRSRFGAIASLGDPPVFDPGHIATIARFHEGDLYDSRKVDDLRQALVATGLFSVVSITPRPGETQAADGTSAAVLEVRQDKGPARSLTGQVGYATGQGFKVDGGWTHRNLFPPEGALIVQGTAGTQEQGLGVAFRRSNAGKRDRTVELSLDARHSNFDAYEAFTGRLAGRISRESTPIWQKRWTYSYGFELVGTNEQDYDFASASLRRRTYYLLALPGQVQLDTSDSLLDPTRGFRVSARLSPEASLGSGAQTYARAMLESSAYYSVSDGIVLAGRARIGSIGGASRTQIAPSRRFYGGGGGSVRGFGYQELGPKDPDHRPIGGRSLVEAAGEVRYRFGNYGVVAFVDAGQVYTSSVPRFTDWRFGAGIGGRFYTNFGPMRLDVATPLRRRPGESRIAVYVSIGQAF